MSTALHLGSAAAFEPLPRTLWGEKGRPPKEGTERRRHSPFSRSLRGALALSRGVSPYLLQMLTRAPLVTRSWWRRESGRAPGTSPLRSPPGHGSLPLPLLQGQCQACPPACASYLGHRLLAPEAGVVQRGVPVLVHRVDVRLELQELRGQGGAQALPGTVLGWTEPPVGPGSSCHPSHPPRRAVVRTGRGKGGGRLAWLQFRKSRWGPSGSPLAGLL